MKIISLSPLRVNFISLRVLLYNKNHLNFDEVKI